MPPKKKKNEDKIIKETSKPQKDQKLRKVVKVKSKPKLKTPTVIKVTIPSTKLSRTVSMINPSLKSTNNDIKIQLSNEVALGALAKPGKSKLVSPVPKAKPIAEKKTRLKKNVKAKDVALTPESCEPKKCETKRGRKKKVPDMILKEEPLDTSGTSENNNTPSSTAELFKNPSPKKKVNNRSTKKADIKKGEVKKGTMESVMPESPKKAPKLIRKRPMKTDVAASPTKMSKRIRGKKVSDETSESIDKTLSPVSKGIDETKISLGLQPGTQDVECSLRRTSTLSDCLSWTKEISSSSTTTLVTVCSTSDFFCIDNKLPLVELKDLKHQNNGNVGNKNNIHDKSSSRNSSSSDSSTSVSLSPKTPEQECSSTPNDDTSPISKSISDPASPAKFIIPHSTKRPDFAKNLQKLEYLKTLIDDLNEDILTWINCDEFSNKDNTPLSQSKGKDKTNHVQEEKEYVKDLPKNSYAFLEKLHMDKQKHVETEPNLVKHKSLPTTANSDDTTHLDQENTLDLEFSQPSNDVFAKPASPKHYNDADEDTLSLYAESLTGMESSEHNNSIAAIAYAKSFKEHEEYIPEPLTKTPKPSQPYNPTKINDGNKLQNDDKNSEKTQETNVTDSNHDKPIQPLMAVAVSLDKHNQEIHEHDNINKNHSHISKYKDNRYQFFYHKMCIYNLAGKCGKRFCNFEHKNFTKIEFSNRLVKLSEEMFISEIEYVLRHRNLWNSFSLAYIEECDRRNLTKILIEMAIVFVQNAYFQPNQNPAKVEVLETVLLHLNSIDLNQYKDLLTCYVKNQMFCDHLMHIIGETQNFSRFSNVFVRLANFLVNNNRKVNSTVTSNIIDRVAILRLDTLTANAVIQVMRISSDLEIVFNNKMIEKFETQLLKLDERLFAELQHLKVESRSSSVVTSNTLMPRMSPIIQEDVRRTSLLERDLFTSSDASILNGRGIIGQLSQNLGLRPITITNEYVSPNNVGCQLPTSSGFNTFTQRRFNNNFQRNNNTRKKTYNSYYRGVCNSDI